MEEKFNFSDFCDRSYVSGGRTVAGLDCTLEWWTGLEKIDNNKLAMGMHCRDLENPLYSVVC